MEYSAAAKGSKASKSWAQLLKGAGLVHKETGLTLESAELGRVKITDSFVDCDTARLRLHIECPADRKGRLPVTLSPIGNVVDHISSRSVVAKEGLLRKGDTVIGVDGMALGQMTLEEALSKDKAIHTLIVHRTDAQLTSIVMKSPPAAISSTYAAPLFRVQVDLTRVVGRSDTVRLGLNVNQHNAILYIVPGSPAAYEGTLAVGDVLVELNGKPLGDSWLVDLLEDEPLQGESFSLSLTPSLLPHPPALVPPLVPTPNPHPRPHPWPHPRPRPHPRSRLRSHPHSSPLPPTSPGESCTLVALRLPNTRRDDASRARAEKASRKRGYHPPPSDERKTGWGGNSLWEDRRVALALSAGDKHVARLVVAGRKTRLIRASTMIQAAYRGVKARRFLHFHVNMAVRIQRQCHLLFAALQSERDRKATNCAAIIQSCFKMQRELKKFAKLRKATVRIQRRIQTLRVIKREKLADSHDPAKGLRLHTLRLARTAGKLAEQLQKTATSRSVQWIGGGFFGDEADAGRASSLGRLPQWSDVPLDGKGYNAAQAVTEMSPPADDKVLVSDISPKQLALVMLEDTETPYTFAENTGSDEKATKGMLFEWSLAKLHLMAEAAKETSTLALIPSPHPWPWPWPWP